MHVVTNSLEPSISMSIKKIVEESGPAYLEHKFISIFSILKSSHKIDFTTVELYNKIFPDFVPTWTSAKLVFDNAFDSTSSFVPLFDKSEQIFRDWIQNFYSTILVTTIKDKFYVNKNGCERVVKEFRDWTTDYKEVVGNFVKKSIEWDLGDFVSAQKVVYEPTNINVKKEILSQLEKHTIVQITTSKKITRIFIENSNITLLKVDRFLINPITLKAWFANLGITLSLVTTTYLIEHGIHYCGRQVELVDMMKTSIGLIKILVTQLRLLLAISTNEPCELSKENHPLRQSVVLALARLENYLRM